MIKQTDPVGEAARAARLEYFTVLRGIAIVLFLLFVASAALNLWQMRRPPFVMITRVDDAGRAQAITYRSGDYTPREAEIRSALNQWAIARFRLLKPTLDNFKSNYFWMDSGLTRQLTPGDADVVASVTAGKIAEQDVQVNSIQFRAFDTKKEADGTVSAGECVIDMNKLYNLIGPTREHWVLTLRYKVNPTAAAERSRRDPAFQLANPLGVMITWFHEDRAL